MADDINTPKPDDISGMTLSPTDQSVGISTPPIQTPGDLLDNAAPSVKTDLPTPPPEPPPAPPAQTAVHTSELPEVLQNVPSDSLIVPPPGQKVEASPLKKPVTAPPDKSNSKSSFGPKKPGVGILMAGLLLLFITLPLAVFYISQQNQVSDTRSRAGNDEYSTTLQGACNNSSDDIICRSDNTVLFASQGNQLLNGYDCRSGRYVSYDACGTPVTNGGSCNGLIRTSNGEAYNGGFVGCQGSQNCFCGGANDSTPVGGTYSGGSIHCEADYANDSCGLDLDLGPGGSFTPTPGDHDNDDTPTPTTPAGPQCTNIKVFKGGVQINPSTLTLGDAVVVTVTGTNASKAHIRINGGAFQESSTKNAAGAFTFDITMPTTAPASNSITIESEIFGNDSQWH
jgi:hypothetical protein